MIDTTQHRRWDAIAVPKDDRARRVWRLEAAIDEERIEAYRRMESLPFTPGKHRRVARLRVGDGGR